MNTMNYFWGMSEAMDIYQEYLDAYKVKFKNEHEEDLELERLGLKEPPHYSPLAVGESEPGLDRQPKKRGVNILMFGSGDPRHVIKTAAKMYTHRDPETKSLPGLNLYLMDKDIETFARNMMLLSIAFENPESGINLRNKVQLFMDVYGNTMVRPATEQYLIGKSKTLSKIISDPKFREKVAPMINLDYVKYKELDGVQACFDFYRTTVMHPIAQLWKNRLRSLLGERYDHRDGAFDWDHSMTLKGRGLTQICSQEYRHWRETGIAFTFPEFEQCKPNRTLFLGVPQTGRSYHYLSFQGDVQTGPYCAFGLKTSDQRMTGSMHGENDYRATDITERNLLELFYELANQKPYEHNLHWSHRYGSVRLRLNPCLTFDEGGGDHIPEYQKPWISIPGLKIYLLCAHELYAMSGHIGRWYNTFDAVFVGQESFHTINNHLLNMMQPNCLLLLETKCNYCLQKDKVDQCEEALKEFCQHNKLTPVINYKVMNSRHPVVKFTKREDPPIRRYSFITVDPNSEAMASTRTYLNHWSNNSDVLHGFCSQHAPQHKTSEEQK